MDSLLADVLELLSLERLEADCFRGKSLDPGFRRVFGGQVLGQALVAAYRTVEGRSVHSLHAYFLRGGDPDHPIEYHVDRSRDGRSFTSRRVVAMQHGAQIFHMSASFQAPEEGLDRQVPMPAVPAPEQVPDMATAMAELERRAPERPRLPISQRQPFEFRPVQMPYFEAEIPEEPQMKIWFRAPDRLPDDPIVHHALLAYASDYYLLGTAGMDVRLMADLTKLQTASIDHAMWFHRPLRMDDWLLYVLESPSASCGRGLGLGKIFSRDGALVASAAQEGLIRVRREQAATG